MEGRKHMTVEEKASKVRKEGRKEGRMSYNGAKKMPNAMQTVERDCV